MIVSCFLGHQVDDAHTANASPHPDVSGFGVGCVAVVAKVFVQRGPLFAQGVCESLIEGVIGGDAVCDGLGFGLEDIAAYFVDHVVFLSWGEDVKIVQGIVCFAKKAIEIPKQKRSNAVENEVSKIELYGVRPWPNDGFVRYALRKFEQKTAGYFSADSAHLIQRVA